MVKIIGHSTRRTTFLCTKPQIQEKSVTSKKSFFKAFYSGDNCKNELNVTIPVNQADKVWTFSSI